ncbi:MAG: hypothetical protein RPT13_03930 [SAR324 cluster bacterium]|jgi:hypothetical protein
MSKIIKKHPAAVDKGNEHIEMFSPSRIAVMREANKHPFLVANLQALKEENPSADWPDQVGVIAAYCTVVLDGIYTPAELDTLCGQLIFKLIDKRRMTIQ